MKKKIELKKAREYFSRNYVIITCPKLCVCITKKCLNNMQKEKHLFKVLRFKRFLRP